jgi:hypothetical protein
MDVWELNPERLGIALAESLCDFGVKGNQFD